MRIARALAAVALGLSLTATVAPAQAAAPRPAPVVAQVTAGDVATAAAPAKTRITVKASAKKVKLGTTVKYTGKLTRKTAQGYKPYAKQQVMLILLDDGRPLLATAKTSASGRYTIKLKTEEWMVGPRGLTLTVVFDGNARSELAWPGWFPLVVTPRK